jgi:hypothetical protein
MVDTNAHHLTSIQEEYTRDSLSDWSSVMIMLLSESVISGIHFTITLYCLTLPAPFSLFCHDKQWCSYSLFCCLLCSPYTPNAGFNAGLHHDLANSKETYRILNGRSA